MRLILTFLLCIPVGGSAWSETLRLTESHWFSPVRGLPDAPSPNSTRLNIEAEFVLDNREWFSAPVDGSTNFGWVTPLTLSYQAESAIRFEAGLVAAYDYGYRDDVDKAEPILRLDYRPNERHQFTFGTLYSNHQMHPALIDASRIFRTNVEQGLQYRHSGEQLLVDAWSNWQIKESDVDAEQFEVALSLEFPLRQDFQVRLMMVENHIGGQQTLDQTELRNTGFAVTLFRGVNWISTHDSLISATWISSYYDLSQGSGQVELASGQGVELEFETNWWLAKQWRAQWFINHYLGESQQIEHGNPLYQARNLQTLGFHTRYQPSSPIQFELGVDFQIVDGQINSSQVISVNWQHGTDLN